MIIRHANILTNDAGQPQLSDGYIHVQDGLIQAMGQGEGPDDADVYDARGKIMLPGFINLHNHIYSALSRGISLPQYQPNNFLDILEGMWWNLDQKLTGDLVSLSARATYAECIRNGVTTIFDHHASFATITGSLGLIADESRKAGLRSSLCFELTDRYGQEKSELAFRENLSFLEQVRRDGQDDLRALFGLHAAFTLEDETLAKVAEQLPPDIGTHVHLSEGEADERLAHAQGTTPLRRLMKYGLIRPNSLAIHGIHLGEADFSLLKSTGAALIHNPQSNMSNAVGYCPVSKFLEQGIRVGLGTDGYTQDMVETARIAALMMRHQSQNPRTGWVEPYAMLLRTNADLASEHFGRIIGQLKVGAVADLILLDYEPFTPFASDNLYGHMHFGMSGAMVSDTMARGRWLMQNRELRTIDEEQLASDATEKARNLWKEMM